MAKRRRISSSGMRRSENVIHVSQMLMWELAWVKKMGLEDVDWDPERDCPHCRAERAARGELVEDLTPPSGTRPRFLLHGDEEHVTHASRASRTRSQRGGKPRHMKLVRLPRIEHEGR
jgi:hypothetical protein